MDTTTSSSDAVSQPETNPIVARLHEDVATFDTTLSDLDRKILELQQLQERTRIQRSYALELLGAVAREIPVNDVPEGATVISRTVSVTVTGDSANPPAPTGRARSLAALDQVNRERRAQRDGGGSSPNSRAPRP